MKEATKFKTGTAYAGWRCVKVNAESVILERNGEAYRFKLEHYETGDKAVRNGAGLWAWQFKPDVLVAVYGTLMRGERNEHWAREADAKVVGEGTVHGWLWDTGHGFPAIQTGGHLLRVAVEVLATDEAGVAHMDMLEGYPDLYGREKVRVTMANGYTLDALIYQMHDMGEKCNRFTLIDPVRGVADWRKYRAGKEG